jgi:isopentenyl diphosphate isomerase/L-lactate dehydrogenase-like FMN-dependent dehydrogenase
MALVNLADYESQAREAISGSVLDYYDGGANDEITLRDNPAAFDRIPLYPRVFRGTDRRDTSTTVLDFPIATPVVVAPVALLGMIHADGEAPAAQAATAWAMTLAYVVVCPFEAVMQRAGFRREHVADRT